MGNQCSRYEDTTLLPKHMTPEEIAELRFSIACFMVPLGVFLFISNCFSRETRESASSDLSASFSSDDDKGQLLSDL